MVLCGIASYSMVLQGPFVFFRYFSLCLYHCLLVGQASLFITRIIVELLWKDGEGGNKQCPRLLQRPRPTVDQLGLDPAIPTNDGPSLVAGWQSSIDNIRFSDRQLILAPGKKIPIFS